MLTPSVCSYSLLLQEKTVFVHVSRMSLQRGRFLELRFDKLLVVDSIYNDFQCPLEGNIRKERFHIKRDKLKGFLQKGRISLF